MKSDDVFPGRLVMGSSPTRSKARPCSGSRDFNHILFCSVPIRSSGSVPLKEGCDQADALALAVAKYHYFPAGLSGLSLALVEDLEIMFPEADLPDALIAAAQNWIDELNSKRGLLSDKIPSVNQSTQQIESQARSQRAAAFRAKADKYQRILDEDPHLENPPKEAIQHAIRTWRQSAQQLDSSPK